MPETADLLVEIGTEELPPKALRKLSDAFTQALREGLRTAGLAPSDAEGFATPRRLAALLRGVPKAQPDQASERRGPAVAVAFDRQGKPTAAAAGFARSCGVAVEQLQRLETPKGSWLVHRSLQQGKPAAELIPGIVATALARLPIPKRMRWADREDEFVRPVHWVVLLLGEQTIPTSLLGVPTGNASRGHRFHAPHEIKIESADCYATTLEQQGRVLANFDARRDLIRQQVEAKAASLGGRALMNDALLDEVTALVEWPVAVVGAFEPKFLEIPAEALVTTMQDHQKYFPLLGEGDRLLPQFVTIANIQSTEPDRVSHGNERVLRARLADAAFFWDQDRAQTLESRLERLKGVVFQEKLGTLYDKTSRVVGLATAIASQLGGESADAERGALLSKCDLMTEMVGEFPELQGVMGRHYALHDGERRAVAVALDEQYMPRFAGDRLSQSPCGQALAIADRLDTLVGIFAIGQRPTGEKDPYALRRAALGVLRTIIENDLPIDLLAMLKVAADTLTEKVEARAVVDEVFDFAMERLRAYYIEGGSSAQTFEAVRSRRPSWPRDFDRRLRAVADFARLPEADSLAAANKRILNILRRAEDTIPETVKADLLRAPEEQALHTALTSLTAEVEPLVTAGDYQPALSALARLKEPVDKFFDAVMVMDEETALRVNRLALLRRVSQLFLRVADVSRLQVG